MLFLHPRAKTLNQAEQQVQQNRAACHMRRRRERILEPISATIWAPLTCNTIAGSSCSVRQEVSDVVAHHIGRFLPLSGVH